MPVETGLDHRVINLKLCGERVVSQFTYSGRFLTQIKET